jgi:hypothetical protein
MRIVHFPPYGHRPYACSRLKAAAAAGPRRTRRGSGSAPAAHSWCAQIINLEARRAERQARETAKGQVDDIRPDTAFSRFFPRGIGRDRTRAKGHGGAGSSGGIITAPEPMNTRATEPEREPAPAPPPRVVYLGRPPMSARRNGSAAMGGCESAFASVNHPVRFAVVTLR